MLTIDKNSSKPYYEQLVLGIKQQVVTGILQPGDRLPSVRELAKELLMNPNTISKAYKVLEVENVIVTVKGKGTFIKNTENIPRDEFRIQQLKQNFQALIIEAMQLQVTKHELISWLEEPQLKGGGTQ
ncbi:GntR family transcriptional regulator [Enterococcus sp. MJM12]|uniref:GntR family transcriptional regulator n=1 Tax=Candidatus Enterococcus myersii TaxID=2815322 RepID=A0ABS3HBH3_9ENTE|nr:MULTISPECIES: GntR family transcriptional regulator [Enterococcus]MBO0450255.1 GntR family transcriptional regulator [Enterococcus sp. MJM12]MCD1023912.1 GntR family transcriptional regulator [Enterococcus sp. SMC-9]MDT2739643.1 GntR family transcriptional regulator [Enterococcus canintestini]WHA10102.1 GntR family transcriptional regulator [Enterococcus montenegrensis]